jgi:hypothetical protein
VIDDDTVNPDGEWLPSGSADATGGQPGGFAPDGYYTYPYPYPFAAVTGEGQPEGTFPPPPHIFQHLHPAGYPPFPPWVQPPFDVAGGTGDPSMSGDGGSAGEEGHIDDTNGAGVGGAARTSGGKKKKGSKRNGDVAGTGGRVSKKGENSANRSARAAKRAIAPFPTHDDEDGHGGYDHDHDDDHHHGRHHHDDEELNEHDELDEHEVNAINSLEASLADVTDPSLLNGTIDPQATTNGHGR